MAKIYNVGLTYSDGDIVEPPKEVLEWQEQNIHKFHQVAEEIIDYTNGDMDVPIANDSIDYLLRDSYSRHPNIHRFYFDARNNGILYVKDSLSNNRLIKKIDAVILENGTFTLKSSLSYYDPNVPSGKAFAADMLGFSGNLTAPPKEVYIKVCPSEFSDGVYARVTKDSHEAVLTISAFATNVVKAISNVITEAGYPIDGITEEDLTPSVRANIQNILENPKTKMHPSNLGCHFIRKGTPAPNYIKDILGTKVSVKGSGQYSNVSFTDNPIYFVRGESSVFFEIRERWNMRKMYRMGGIGNLTIYGATTKVGRLKESIQTENNKGSRLAYSTDVMQYKVGFKDISERKSTELEKSLFPLTKTRPVYLGLELEVNTKNSGETAVREAIKAIADSPFGNDCVIKSDSSTGENGFEIVTIPATLAYHQSVLSEHFFNGVINKLLISTPRCGIHVHIGKDAFTKLSFGKFISFINSSKNSAFITQMAGRPPNNYCERWNIPEKNKKGVDISASIGAKVIKKISGSLDKDSWKTTGVGGFPRGAVNVGKGPTIEVRIFKSSVEKPNVLRKLEFCHAVTMFARSDVSLQNLDVPHFIEFVLDKRWADNYPNLIRFLEAKKYLVKEVKITPDKKRFKNYSINK